jgi:hypothetical protein
MMIVSSLDYFPQSVLSTFLHVFPIHLQTLEARYFDSQNPPSISRGTILGEKIYEIELSTSGLRLRKEHMGNKASLLAINGCTVRLWVVLFIMHKVHFLSRLVETEQSGIRHMKNLENMRELESLHDTEGHWRKWQRWFIGFNWKALLF